MRIYLASDHAGFELKRELIDFLKSEGHDAEDCGAHEYDPADDYPEIIARAARKLSEDVQRGGTSPSTGSTSFDEAQDKLLTTSPLGASPSTGSTGFTTSPLGASRAIVIGASGQGEAMVANRFRGVRCALYYGPPAPKATDGQRPAAATQIDASGKHLDILEGTRTHNDANALSLAARFLSPNEAKEAVKRWLAIPFSGEERHARRIRSIDTIA